MHAIAKIIKKLPYNRYLIEDSKNIVVVLIDLLFQVLSVTSRFKYLPFLTFFRIDHRVS